MKALVKTDEYFGDMTYHLSGHRIISLPEYYAQTFLVREIFAEFDKRIGFNKIGFPVSFGYYEEYFTSFNKVMKSDVLLDVSQKEIEVISRVLGNSVGYNCMEQIIYTANDTMEDDFEKSSKIYKMFIVYRDEYGVKL